MGDVDGDGKADIAVGAPYEDVDGNEDQGRAYVFSGADGSLFWILDILEQPWGSAFFGSSVAVGNVDDDGEEDIAVGAFGARAVYVFAGGGSSPTPTPTPFPPVGGIAELPDVPDSSGRNYIALAGLAAAVVALSAGGWFARRHWLR